MPPPKVPSEGTTSISVGNLRLLEEVFSARTPWELLRHKSYIYHGGGSREREAVRVENGILRTERHFPAAYAPAIGEGLLGHVAFALKHEVPHLGVFAAAFAILPPEEIGKFVAASPTGAYARRIGFLYELLTGRDLSPFLREVRIGGNYVDLLDPTKLVTVEPRRDTRWRIDNNLPGGRAYAPLIERTQSVLETINHDWQADVDAAMASGAGDPELLHRALNYLYIKETRSSFAIERETPSDARAARFVATLKQAGQGSDREALSESALTRLQNSIVEPRYIESGYRVVQNYVSETVHWKQHIHYVPPPPEPLRDLMAGLAEAATGLSSVPVAQAAVASFGFVFHHPFEDGNGRAHRFLLHDFMVRSGVIPGGLALPVSAAILADMRAYDHALEAYSRPVAGLVEYKLDDTGRMAVTNGEAVAWLWRYPDLTPQVEFLGRVLRRAVGMVAEEIAFLSRYDRLAEKARETIDMPDRRMSELLAQIHANGGRLSNNKRKQRFSEMRDEEISAIEAAYAEVFGPVRVATEAPDPPES